jgi:hypothetical protein
MHCSGVQVARQALPQYTRLFFRTPVAMSTVQVQLEQAHFTRVDRFGAVFFVAVAMMDRPPSAENVSPDLNRGNRQSPTAAILLRPARELLLCSHPCNFRRPTFHT